MAKNKKDVRVKVQKEMPEFTDVMDSLSADDLEKRLATYAKESESVDDAKEADEGLEAAKSQVKEYSAPYSETKKAIKLKMRYIIAIIGDKGGSA